MGEVVQLKKPAARKAASDAEHYFCMRCDADTFRAYPTGAMHCAKCGSLMQNIFVNDRTI